MMNESYELVRNKVAFLDLQTEGRFFISGRDAESALDQLLSIDLEVLPFWRGTIGLFLTEMANIIAIATIFKSEEGFYVFTEASSADDLGHYLANEIPARGAVFEDLRQSHALFSVLGPQAQNLMSKILISHLKIMNALAHHYSVWDFVASSNIDF
jgi:glycine cleavage system aminomethyltransferase T